MSNTPPRAALIAQQLAQLMESEVALLRNFLALLAREEDLLVQGETDSLLNLTREKTELYHLLQRQHEARMRLLGQAGLEGSADNIRKVCAALPSALANWDELLKQAEEARARNESNGKLIIERMQHNQGALSILMSSGRHTQFYDAEGVSRVAGRGRHLGSA